MGFEVLRLWVWGLGFGMFPVATSVATVMFYRLLPLSVAVALAIAVDVAVVCFLIVVTAAAAAAAAAAATATTACSGNDCKCLTRNISNLQYVIWDRREVSPKP